MAFLASYFPLIVLGAGRRVTVGAGPFVQEA